VLEKYPEVDRTMSAKCLRQKDAPSHASVWKFRGQPFNFFFLPLTTSFLVSTSAQHTYDRHRLYPGWVLSCGIAPVALRCDDAGAGANERRSASCIPNVRTAVHAPNLAKMPQYEQSKSYSVMQDLTFLELL
jgi:hypothetical protein